MKKDYLLLIGVIAIIIPLIFLGLSLGKRQGKINISPTPSVSTVPTRVKESFVVSFYPADNSTNVALDTNISFVFVPSVKLQEVNFSILPPVQYEKIISGQSLTVKPKALLSAGTKYSIVLGQNNSSSFESLSFTTVGATPTNLPDTRPSGEPSERNTLLRQTRPDIFLKNNTPYSTADFSISSNFTTTPAEHFYFLVLLFGDKNNSKISFIAWLKSLGLEDSQIQGLDLLYQ